MTQVQFDASRNHLPRFRQSTAADLCVPTAAVPSDTPNSAVLQLFTERRDLMSLPVLEEGRPIGLISRNIFMSQMSKPYYHELYGKKSCIAFMDKDPLIVDSNLSIESLTFRAVESGEKALADGFIITRDGELAGVGFGMQLMNVVANIQAERNRQIMHSIEYASVIQRSLLRSSREALDHAMIDAHLEWQPRDMVGGDFFLVQEHKDGWFAAIADCTGHGVPGAFMTLIASSVLTQALQQLGPRDPGKLMTETSRGVKAMLGQTEERRSMTESDDGLDAAFLWYDRSERRLRYAGARLALQVFTPEQEEPSVWEGERAGLGYVDTPAQQVWPNHTIQLDEGSLVFVTTDGLTDQIGGPKSIAYGKRRVREQLLARRNESAAAAAEGLLNDMRAWQGDQPRRDDLTFFCFRP
jgi:serine phosphatase RsbU (regulator of sigma subunit)